MAPRRTSRRRLLRAGGIVGAIGVAGCSRLAGGGGGETVIDDFEGGGLDSAWHQFADARWGQAGFEVQSETAPEGQYALRGINDRYGEHYSGIQRDDFVVDQDGSTLRLHVKLGEVMTGSERANKVFFTSDSAPLIIVDQKDRPGDQAGARIGNRNFGTVLMNTVRELEFRDISFSENAIGEVVVDGESVGTDVPFLNPGDEISAIKVYQGHFFQPTDIVVDRIAYEA